MTKAKEERELEIYNPANVRITNYLRNQHRSKRIRWWAVRAAVLRGTGIQNGNEKDRNFTVTDLDKKWKLHVGQGSVMIGYLLLSTICRCTME
jgi:hypothetical protein